MPSRSDDSHSIFRPSFQSKAPEADPVGVHLQSGDSVGDFELVKLIGHGGMGSVWAAYEKSLDRAVALKVIRPDRVDSKAVEMFHREARAGGRLSHPGLVSVYSSGEGGGVHHIALEMVGDGHNLAHVLKTLREQESVPDGYYGEVAEFVLAVAEAMESAHQADVIHRDLKPQNILIDAEGEPRITDFGLARIVGERSLSGREVVGTYFYMSPEQAMAKSVGIDLRTDIFSLGVVMYELLTLKRPFDGDTEQQIQKQIIWEDPFAPRAVRSRVPADLSVICMKCLEKRAEHRFASMAELVADLRRHLIHEPIRAKQPGPVLRVQKWVRRYPTLSVAAGGGGVALVIILILFMLTLQAERLARASAHDAQQTARLAREQEQEAKRQRQRAELAQHTVEELMLQVAELARVELGDPSDSDDAGSDPERARVLKLSDLKRLRELKARAGDLWPVHPNLLAPLGQWIDEANEVIANLPLHRDSLAELRARSSTVSGIMLPGQVEFESLEDSWWYETLHGLVQDLTAFADTGANDPDGIVASVEARLQRSKAIEQRSIFDFEEEWEDAITEIVLDDRYGFELEPLIGLVPLGTDPDSGLWEFWHLESGERPERDPESGRHRVSDRTGIVLVLIPEGDFIMGAEGTKEEWDLAPYLAKGYEFPQHRVRLDPFFLSKYEMTVGQWARIDGPNRMRDWTGQSVQQAHPIGTIAWLEADLYVHRFGLRLPTDAQWEYACRAGTQSLFWTGDSLSDLASAENLADRSYGRIISNVIFEPWNDGASFPSLVGSFRPNSFGLFDMAGNIGEWCRDWLVSFSTEPRPGDGERWPSAETPSDRTVRGGTFSKPATDARSSCRWGNAPYATIDYLGVRPSLGIHAVE